MGGYGALRLALERPDLFKAAVSHSGAVGMGRYFPTPGDGSKWEAEFIRVFGKVEKGGRNDLIQLASNLKGNPQDSTNRLPALRIDCGTEDFLLEHNRQLNRDLTALGIPHEYEEFLGDHNWEYWDQHVQEAIAFCLRNLS
jgi:S-formylglutathione hydrolase FrmB